MIQHSQPFAAAARYRRLDLDSRVAAASPHELVALLFEGLRDALVAAEQALDRHRATARLRAVTRALSILDGLESSLDPLRGGAVARSLGNVYAQVRALVVAGNAESRPELFSGAALQIAAIAQAWEEIAPRRAVAH